MSWRTGLARLRALMRSEETLERELEEEMQEHIRLETQDNIDSGIDPVEARRLATVRTAPTVHVGFGSGEWAIAAALAVVALLPFADRRGIER